MRSEIKELTTLRAIAILILLVAHLHDYVDLWLLWVIFQRIGNVCLAFFGFVTGYCLVLGKDIDSFARLTAFFKRRWLRIYSLYLPALIIFCLIYEHSYSNKIVVFLIHFSGLQVLFTKVIPPYNTIWYIGLVITFYVLYALCNYASCKLQARTKEGGPKPILTNTSALLAVSFVALCLLSLRLPFDNRLTLYFPAFVAGVAFAEQGYLQGRTFKPRTYAYLVAVSFAVVAAFLASVLIASLSFLSPALLVGVKAAAISMTAITGALALSLLSRHVNVVPRYVEYLSYSSYAIYLFHRPMLRGVQAVLTYLHVENVYAHLFLYSLLIIPLIVIPISNLIQRGADSALARIANRRSQALG